MRQRVRRRPDARARRTGLAVHHLARRRGCLSGTRLGTVAATARIGRGAATWAIGTPASARTGTTSAPLSSTATSAITSTTGPTAMRGHWTSGRRKPRHTQVNPSRIGWYSCVAVTGLPCAATASGHRQDTSPDMLNSRKLKPKSSSGLTSRFGVTLETVLITVDSCIRRNDIFRVLVPAVIPAGCPLGAGIHTDHHAIPQPRPQNQTPAAHPASHPRPLPHWGC